ncbi:kelch-like protein 5 isoform X2 [Dreissena polymorpha]|uniref:kelch-like protein 5 isoform X2 n=1 Tax=Dreissena polymorpha TaxID=45954 RepID=UPI002264F96C|nr:kelch-like protein 5 isoform X2 [Dreissena polymorpha]
MFQSTPLTYHLDRPHGQLSSSAQPDMNFGQTNHPASYTIKANNTPRTGQQPSLSLGYMKSVVRDLENHGPLCSDSGLADSGQPNFSESQTGITGHNLGQTSLSSYSLDEASQVSPPLSFSSKSSYNLGETNRLFRYNFGRPSQSSHNIGQVGHNIGQLRHNIGPCGSEGHARQPSNAAQSVIAPYELFGQRNCGPIMGEAGLNQVNAGPTSAAFLRSEVAPPTFLSDLDGERSYTAANAQGYLVHHTYAGSSYTGKGGSKMEETGDAFHSMNHAERMLKKMEEYSHKHSLCDVYLVCGQRRIPAHRLVLSAASDYFAAMFTNDVREANMEEIKMKEMDPDALEAIVKFAYTGTIELREDTVENLLATACMLQLSEVVEACCNFLMKQLHPSNCIGIRQFADAQGCCDLYKVANNYVMERFGEVMNTQEFLILPPDEVAKLLASDDLNIQNEETIYSALVMWINHDQPARKKYLAKLMSHIRLPLMSPQFIADNVETNPLFKDSKECQGLIMEALKYHLLPERRSSFQSPRTKPRKSTVGMMFAVGGMDSNKGPSTIEKYDLRTNTWTQVANMNGRRLQFGVAVLDNKLYIVGGREGLKTLNTVECYDLKKKTWTLMPPMSTHRHGLGVGVLEGPMYAVGGHDGWSYLNTVERWDPQAKQWSYVAPMSTPRSTVGVAVLFGKLYAVGGRDGSSCLKSVECFDPHTNKWMPCTPMSKRRGGVGVATCNGFLYAVGGHEAPATNPTCCRFDCAERYDPKTDQWTMIAPISNPRDAVGMCLLGDRLYAVGGYDGQHYLKDVESYDPVNNEWSKVASLSTGRAGAYIVHVPHS